MTSEAHGPTDKIQLALWIGLIVVALGWYGNYRVYSVVRHAPYSAGFHGNDFKHIYLGARMFARGENPYDGTALLELAHKRGFRSVNPYVYPPFTALALRPLTWFDPPTAMRVWFWFNHLLFFASMALIFHALKLRASPQNLAFALCLGALCYPLHSTLTAGQLNLVLLVLFALVFDLQSRGRLIAAGVVAAVAMWLKLIPGILLFYFLWVPVFAKQSQIRKLWQSSRSVWAMLISGVVILALCVLVVGVQPHRDYLQVLGQMGYGQSTFAEHGEVFFRAPKNQSFNAFFNRVLVPVQGFTPWFNGSKALANVLSRIALLTCLLAVAWRARPWGRGMVDLPVAYGLFILLGLLTPSIFWNHYIVLALWPLMAAYSRIDEPQRGLMILLMLCLVLPLGGFLNLPTWAMCGFLIAAMALTARLFLCFGVRAIQAVLLALAAALMLARFLFTYPPFFQGVGLLAMSIKLWGTLLLFGILLYQVRTKSA